MARVAAMPLPFAWPSWEYQDVSIPYDGSWAAALDELGREGWMLISIVHDEGVDDDAEVRAVLMRPKSGVGSAAKAEGRVTKRKSKTTETGHEQVVDDGDEEP